jgi:hypothetical protein
VAHHAFDHIEMSAMRLAIDHLLDEMGPDAEKHRFEIAGLVFRLGAQTGAFETSALVEMAREQWALTDRQTQLREG